jgi:hydroxyacylglutathione hydrolase
MPIKIKVFPAGPLVNNACILYDEAGKQAFVVDPSFEPQPLLDFLNENALTAEMILITHGHFDHFAGVAYLLANLPKAPKLALHPADLEIWKDGGGSRHFRMPLDAPGNPDVQLADGQILTLGSAQIEVRLTPGHSHGSVVFYIPELKTAICGDVIFHHSIGRTDLTGGNLDTLLNSIRSKVFTLPMETTLVPGHGMNTTVGEEIKNNPFLN